MRKNTLMTCLIVGGGLMVATAALGAGQSGAFRSFQASKGMKHPSRVFMSDVVTYPDVMGHPAPFICVDYERSTVKQPNKGTVELTGCHHGEDDFGSHLDTQFTLTAKVSNRRATACRVLDSTLRDFEYITMYPCDYSGEKYNILKKMPRMKKGDSAWVAIYISDTDVSEE